MSNRPGRPRIDPNDKSVRVNVAIPSKRYDALYAIARAERVTIQELFRRSLTNKDIQTTKSSGS